MPKVNASQPNDCNAGPQRDWFLVSVLASEVLLISSTWRLWFTGNSFPAVPLFSDLATMPVYADWFITGLFIAANLIWFVVLLFPIATRKIPLNLQMGSSWCAFVCAVLLAMLNQHRLQPWHWLFILLAGQTLLIAWEHQTWLRRLTVASVYIFAGLSRLGPDISRGTTRQLVTAACQNLGTKDVLHYESHMYRLCILMVCTEVVIGIALLLPMTRRLAVYVAVVMHIILIALLSPLGLNHDYGVLIWNGFFVISVPWLFARKCSMLSGKRPLPEQVSNKTNLRGALAFATFVVLFPLSGLFGLADNWLSWQVYSPRPDVVRLFVKEKSKDLLPPPVQPFVGPPAPLGDWCPVRIDRWSLSAVGAPLYPEDRFQLAITLHACRNVPTTDVQVSLESSRLLFWQGRRTEDLVNTKAIRKRVDGRLFNGSESRD